MAFRRCSSKEWQQEQPQQQQQQQQHHHHHHSLCSHVPSCGGKSRKDSHELPKIQELHALKTPSSTSAQLEETRHLGLGLGRQLAVLQQSRGTSLGPGLVSETQGCCGFANVVRKTSLVRSFSAPGCLPVFGRASAASCRQLSLCTVGGANEAHHFSPGHLPASASTKAGPLFTALPLQSRNGRVLLVSGSTHL